MKQIFIILLFIIYFVGCKVDEFSNDVSSFNSVKIYDLDVIKVKKVHDQYALINLSKVLFIDKSGNKTFDFDNESYIKDNNISFRFTDVVEGENDAIYILASELLDDGTFSIYVFKIDNKGMSLWDSPKVIAITDTFENSLFDFNRTKNQFYTILDNGYVLGKMINGQLMLAVNYQNAKNKYWRYRIISIKYDGNLSMQNDFESIDRNNWTYVIDQLPNNNLVLVQGSNYSCFINQYDPLSLINLCSYPIEGIPSNRLNFITLTNMVTLTSSEVLFTGHADRINNEFKARNFDVFYLRFNMISNTVTDSVFTGDDENNELVFYSFLDDQNIVKCIGTKRQPQISTHTTESTLFQSNLKTQSGEIDLSLFLENKGYEGLFFEESDNNEMTIIGSKIDISGNENKQSFFTIIKIE